MLDSDKGQHPGNSPSLPRSGPRGSAALEVIKNSDLKFPQPNLRTRTHRQTNSRSYGRLKESRPKRQRRCSMRWSESSAVIRQQRTRRASCDCQVSLTRNTIKNSMCRPRSNQRRHTTIAISRFPLIHRKLPDTTMKRQCAAIAIQCHAEPIGARLGLCQTRHGSRRRTRRNNSKDCRLSRRRQARPRILRPSHGRESASGVRTEDRPYLRKWAGTIGRKREELLIRIATW